MAIKYFSSKLLTKPIILLAILAIGYSCLPTITTTKGIDWRVSRRFDDSMLLPDIIKKIELEYSFDRFLQKARFFETSIRCIKYENSYSTKQILSKNELSEYKTTVKNIPHKNGQILFFVGNLALSSLLFATIVAPIVEPAEEYAKIPDILYFSSAGISLLGLLTAYLYPEKKQQTQLTGRSKEEITARGPVIEGALISRYKLSEGTANTKICLSLMNNKFKFMDMSSNINYSTYRYTDNVGFASFEVIEMPENWAFAEAELRHKVPSMKIVREIRDSIRPSIINKINNLIEDASQPIFLETCEQPSKGEIVNNANETFNLEGKEIKYESIYSIIQDFIDSEINSKIKLVTLNVKDIDSHVEVNKPRFEVKTSSPTPLDLARKYFTGDLLEWTTGKILEYIENDAKLEGSDEGTVRFYVYLPASYEIEVIHPKYNYGKVNIVFDDDSLEKTIYVSELGTKVRIQVVKRSS